jgi:anti-sigma B factor antagonist
MDLQVGAPFTVSVRPGHGVVVLDILGEFDLSEVETFHLCVDAIIASFNGAVVLDLAGVSFIDSSALSAILAAQRWLTDECRELRLQNLSAPVKRILEVTGLTDLLGESGSGPELSVWCPMSDAGDETRRGIGQNMSLPRDS